MLQYRHSKVDHEKLISQIELLKLNLQYLSYQQIDKVKWDDCINKSSNRLIYAESIYLDNMCEHWDAIILDDYKAVMPIPWKKKMGIKYIYQPPFTQQGGIYSSLKLPEEILESFIIKASQHFKFATFTLNYSNLLNLKKASPFEYKLRNNFILPMNENYIQKSNSLSNDFRRKLKKSTSFNLKYSESENIKLAIHSFKKNYQDRNLNLKAKDYSNFEELCKYYKSKNRLIIRKVDDEENLLSIVLLLKDNNRIYNLLPCLFDVGKEKFANYFLYNCLIEEFSENNLILDFEGSEIKGVANFYSKITSMNQPYPFIKFNNLPKLVKLIKK